LTTNSSGPQPIQKPNSVAPTTDPSTQVPSGQTSNTCATDNTCGTPGTQAGPASYTYTVNYFGNGSTSGSMSSQTGSAASFTLIGNTFSRTSYTFKGWSLSSGSTSVAYNDGQSVNLTAATTLNLYAVWYKSSSGSTYDAYVNYYPNGGTGTASLNNKYSGVRTFNLSSLSTLGFAKSGYVFNGWATSSGGSMQYADGAFITLTNDVTWNLYATWVPKSAANTNPASGNGGYKKDMPTSCSGLNAGIHITAGAWNNQAIDQLNQLIPERSNSYLRCRWNLYRQGLLCR